MYTAFNTQTEGVKYLVLINCGATIGRPSFHTLNQKKENIRFSVFRLKI